MCSLVFFFHDFSHGGADNFEFTNHLLEFLPAPFTALGFVLKRLGGQGRNAYFTMAWSPPRKAAASQLLLFRCSDVATQTPGDDDKLLGMAKKKREGQSLIDAELFSSSLFEKQSVSERETD